MKHTERNARPQGLIGTVGHQDPAGPPGLHADQPFTIQEVIVRLYNMVSIHGADKFSVINDERKPVGFSFVFERSEYEIRVCTPNPEKLPGEDHRQKIVSAWVMWANYLQDKFEMGEAGLASIFAELKAHKKSWRKRKEYPNSKVVIESRRTDSPPPLPIPSS